MAKVKKKDKDKKGNNKTSAELKTVTQDLKDAIAQGDNLGLFTPSEKLDTAGLEALTDPTSAAYIGQRTKEDKDILEAAQNQVKNAATRSEDMTSLLALFKDGLAGLNAQENQALKESAQREVNREYETGLAELAKAQSRNRTRSAAASSQINAANKSKLQASRELEQDLIGKNIDIQDSRRNQYGKFLSDLESNEFNRTSDSLKNLATMTSDIDKKEFGKVYDTRGQLLDSKKFNIDMSGKDKASKVTGATGLLGLAYTNANNRRTYNLTKQGMARSGRSSGTSTGGNSNQALVDELTRLGQENGVI